MNDSEFGHTFRDLPLTDEQDKEIRHYIHVKMRSRQPWDTPELQAMLADMLDPPEVLEEESGSVDTSMAAEHFTAAHEELADIDALPDMPR
jgi:hypothetical protein